MDNENVQRRTRHDWADGDRDREVRRTAADGQTPPARQTPGGITYPPGTLPHVTSAVLFGDSGNTHFVPTADTDVCRSPSILFPCCSLRIANNWTPRQLFGQGKDGKRLMKESCRKELASLVEDTGPWVLVSLEKSRLLRCSARTYPATTSSGPVLACPGGHDGTQEAKCRCILQMLKDPMCRMSSVEETESSTLSTS